ncbi:MAG TPA: hypothetical protein VFG46_13645 [Chryseolinea sp.]|nr:hypothetical protein [Chryseolinea sp.]
MKEILTISISKPTRVPTDTDNDYRSTPITLTPHPRITDNG